MPRRIDGNTQTMNQPRICRAEALPLDPEAAPEEAHVPVLVVGAGACGLTAALMLHDAGVACALLERDATALPAQVEQAREKAFRAPLLMLVVVDAQCGDADIDLLERTVSAGCAEPTVVGSKIIRSARFLKKNNITTSILLSWFYFVIPATAIGAGTLIRIAMVEIA